MQRINLAFNEKCVDHSCFSAKTEGLYIMADQHPDIVQLRREIDDLESDLAVNACQKNIAVSR